MIFPSIDRVKEIAAAGTFNTVPVCKTILADTETPVSVYLKIFKNRRHTFILESVTGGEHTARYSFIGGDPFITFAANGHDWTINGERKSCGSGDPLAQLRSLLSDFSAAPVEGLPRLSGGAVGYFSYDSIRLRERIPDKNPQGNLVDEIFFGLYREIIVFDHREHRVMLIHNLTIKTGEALSRAYEDALKAIGKLEERLADHLMHTDISVRQTGDVKSNVTRSEYEASVRRCKEYILAGDIFQVVLSQQFSVEVEAQPIDLYRVLRAVNPSPYMFFMSLGDAYVIGASPEMLVRVENGLVENRPIAGTKPRGKNSADDQRLEAELKADPKELAEHVMLVDLGRNDVGRVSQTGSIVVENMMHIERYSHVMHLVTDISGRLRPGLDAFDALYSCFPAGTLSGAPKIRAMEIIDELESSRRGLYGGALGYVDFSGNLDSCIVIRTMIYKDKTAYIQTGAGIVADSDPAKEYDECVAKAGALFTAIQSAHSITGRTHS